MATDQTVAASRRGFLLGIGSLIAAPAIVRIGSIMPVRGIVIPFEFDDVAQYVVRTSIQHGTWRVVVPRLPTFGRSPAMCVLETAQKTLDALRMYRQDQCLMEISCVVDA